MMLRMSNLYCFIFSIILIYSSYLRSTISLKINTTLQLINEELIMDCVSNKGLIDAIEEDNQKYLYINQDLLKSMVNSILSNNLKNIDYKVEYYFYDYSTIDQTYINKDYCNSVQMKITFNYQKTNYEKVLRFEPTKEGD